MQIEPIHKTSVVQDAISKIKELIDQEYFKFGEKLPPERELARLLGISLPSLREALRALSILGIAEMKPGSGTYLRSSMSDWSSDPFSLLFHLRKPIQIDLFEARKGIEGIIAELAAKKRTEEDLQTMEAACSEGTGLPTWCCCSHALPTQLYMRACMFPTLPQILSTS